MNINENTIIDVLKQCFDPEIPIDLWNLGLEAVEEAKTEKVDVVILDTAGRLHVDGEMMVEIQKISDVQDLTSKWF